MSYVKRLVAITGTTGFVGRGIVGHLSGRSDYALRVAVRSEYRALDSGIEVVTIPSMEPDTFWTPFVADAQVVIHTAARVHVMNDTAASPEAEYRRVNVAGTLNLAEQAAAAGVKRFIFISSIKVNGEATQIGAPFTADQQTNPGDPYGVSKAQAEEGLREIAARTGMEVVIIRPVLVYGPGVKANFLSMMRWLDKGIALPLGAIHNKRSLVALDNLVDLIATCIHHPAAANQTFLVSDGNDLSTTELLQHMARSLDKPARLLPVPMWMLKVAAAAVGKVSFSQRLCGSLQVDIGKTCTMLGWTPPVRVEDAMKATAHYFLEHKNDE
ncbi:SDR family oxidoreductase [Pseudomonas sp. JUb42]|jgi:nucleoside-diphosphate-sugar epimerase|uniref:UDP-glucose 4-epimerase family protein n=1 Tax=Pseudomonas sp. JUb42 TaxID=2940611 RepID=UPI00216814B2|nr:SDR family oxidoreductase [Pseudomonas sp. JUb42]